MQPIGSFVSYLIAIARCSASRTLGSSRPRIITVSCPSNSLEPRRLPKCAMSAPRYWVLIGSECSSSPVSAHRTGLLVTTSVLKSPTSTSRLVGSGLPFPLAFVARFIRLPFQKVRLLACMTRAFRLTSISGPASRVAQIAA
jgi:hypothetical protein